MTEKKEVPGAPGTKLYLGRLYAEDNRDSQYQMKVNFANAQKRGWRYWYSAGALNQGATPHCVAYSGVKYLTAGPVRNTVDIPDFTALYNECQKNDEWPGEDYDGTSVRALFKVLKREGYVSEYRWAWDVDTVVAHVLEHGPVVIGSPWYYNMYWPDQNGYLSVSGPGVGGHAYTIIGANRNRKNPDGTRGALRVLNSWGEQWGENGRAWLSYDDFKKLFDSGWAEACTAMENTVGTD